MKKLFSDIFSSLKSLYMPAAVVLLVYPALLILFAFLYVKQFSFGLFEAMLMVSTYYIINISVGVGLHRYWSHAAFSLNRVVQFILLILASASLQGPVLMWASDHAMHHMYTDSPKDPHSPNKFNGGIKGFLWAHIGWMLFRSPNKEMDRGTLKRLGRDPMLLFQFKHYWTLAILTNTLIPALIGFAITRSWIGALAAFIFMGLGRAIQQHGTFCVNSMTHYFGRRLYEKGGSAGDIFWMAPFLLGENWHSFHHAFPSDYRNGVELHHFDVHKWIIWLLEKVGLAWDVKRTSEVRIMTQRRMVISDAFKGASMRWSDVRAYLLKADASTKGKLAGYLSKYDDSISSLSAEIGKILNSDQLSKKLLHQASTMLEAFEKKMREVENMFGRCA